MSAAPLGGAQGPALGLVGVGTMGAALARNLAGQGRAVACFDVDGARLRNLAGDVAVTVPCADLAALVAALSPPRVLLLMVNAGRSVDDVLDPLLPLLGPGDIVLDGGNSHYRDTRRRAAAARAHGVEYLGVGISGGEDGARNGASIMVGGPRDAFERVAPLLSGLAARVDNQPCLGWMGGDGAGHFVKMVHNGIEYAVMQLIAETWNTMERLLDLTPDECAERIADWTESDMGSYLLEITAELLAARDKLTGKPMIEMVGDRAGQKGTGQWAAAAALELGVCAPTLAEAVFARNLSALAEHRRAIAATRPPRIILDMDTELGLALAPALDAATLCAYAQGFSLIAAAAAAEGWSTDLAEVARVWRAGCIIRSKALREVGLAFRDAPTLPTLLLDPDIAGRIARGALEMRSVVSIGALHGVAMPCLSSALAYYDAYGDTRLWTTLIQVQRDRFGAHGFERTDRPGRFHLDGSDA